MNFASESPDFSFVSAMPEEFREELQRLIFVHPLQGRMRLSILDHARLHGAPHIVRQGKNLRVTVQKIPDAQNLFVLTETEGRVRLLGFALYTRAGEYLDILFLAVRHAYTDGGRMARFGLTYRLMDELKRIAHHVKGVAGVRLHYRKGPALILPVGRDG